MHRPSAIPSLSASVVLLPAVLVSLLFFGVPLGWTADQAQIGVDNSKPIFLAPDAWKKLRKPVATVFVNQPGARTCGTGYLIDDIWLMTAAHSATKANGGALDLKVLNIYFNVEDSTDPYEKDRRCFDGCFPDLEHRWKVDEVKVLSPATDLDIALIKIKPMNKLTPGSEYGHLKVRVTDALADEVVHVIHQATGGCKEYSNDAMAKVIKKDDKDCHPQGTEAGGKKVFAHGADTDHGSSGAPVFDDKGFVFGTHTAGFSDGSKNCATKLKEVESAVGDAGAKLDKGESSPRVAPAARCIHAGALANLGSQGAPSPNALEICNPTSGPATYVCELTDTRGWVQGDTLRLYAFIAAGECDTLPVPLVGSGCSPGDLDSVRWTCYPDSFPSYATTCTGLVSVGPFAEDTCDPDQDVQPGADVSLAFSAANFGSCGDEFSYAVIDPRGWIVSSDLPLTGTVYVPPNQERVIHLVVHVPVSSASGDTDSLSWTAHPFTAPGQVARCTTLITASNPLLSAASPSSDLWLGSPVPNPTAAGFTIPFQLSVDGLATVRIHDLGGRHVRTIFDGPLRAGRHQATWDTRTGSGIVVEQGVYFLVIESGKFRAAERLVVIH